MILALGTWRPPAHGQDLKDVLKAGKLRHLGIPYANFVSSRGDGLDVELMQRFAAHLGVDYEFVQSSWPTIIPDLTGKTIRPEGDDVAVTGSSEVRGDVIATGFTVLAWRRKIVNFSTASFPTGVWLITRADSKINPVTPSGSIRDDIDTVKAGLNGHSVLALKDSCLDPGLYQLGKTGATIQLLDPERDLDEMIPLVIARRTDTSLMDVPVALIALEKWPGQIKVVGPISLQQEMAPAFAKSSPELLAAFEAFFKHFKEEGTYNRLVAKYYPTVFAYYPDFF
ncbi:ABC transporter substrate-binding protein [Desulfosarcina alkanivorans]|uniref:ABC transporter substrate-binding protein n=1 Tax=Desulfosarcina alkanivorans TaxID=571177 RepID=A0A5K7YZB6_9BACT|nr:transporter substrate-binding domain-containing protein [Desulfosarcina alkanivorans]BBO72531.1 ABC transporter substrate-binding protein [Desulfosarcina alkanivorans]